MGYKTRDFNEKEDLIKEGFFLKGLKEVEKGVMEYEMNFEDKDEALAEMARKKNESKFLELKQNVTSAAERVEISKKRLEKAQEALRKAEEGEEYSKNDVKDEDDTQDENDAQDEDDVHDEDKQTRRYKKRKKS